MRRCPRPASAAIVDRIPRVAGDVGCWISLAMRSTRRSGTIGPGAGAADLPVAVASAWRPEKGAACHPAGGGQLPSSPHRVRRARVMVSLLRSGASSAGILGVRRRLAWGGWRAWSTASPPSGATVPKRRAWSGYTVERQLALQPAHAAGASRWRRARGAHHESGQLLTQTATTTNQSGNGTLLAGCVPRALAKCALFASGPKSYPDRSRGSPRDLRRAMREAPGPSPCERHRMTSFLEG